MQWHINTCGADLLQHAQTSSALAGGCENQRERQQGSSFGALRT